MAWYKQSQTQNLQDNNDFWDTFDKMPSRKVIKEDSPRTENIVLELYRGFNLDPAKLETNPNGQFILSPKRSEQGVLWFTHKLISAYNPIDYVKGRGNYILIYPLVCKRHIQTTYYDDGSNYDKTPEFIEQKTEGTENCQFYQGYELPPGWFFSYKMEKFIICDHNITVSPDMLRKDETWQVNE